VNKMFQPSPFRSK